MSLCPLTEPEPEAKALPYPITAAKTAFIRTFGCQMNERDSEIMAQLLGRCDCRLVPAPEAADLVLVNTCSIRDKAEQKVYSLLGHLRDVQAKYGRPRWLGVAGCVAQQEGERLIERMPVVNLVIGTQQFFRLPELLARLEHGEKHVVALDLSKDFVIPPFQNLLKSPSRADAASEAPVQRFVNIMQGCNNFCSYCVVPYTRGREISRPFADILEEVRLLVDQGTREITLLGQNVNSYGKTNQVAAGPRRFPDLLRAVAQVPGLKRLRFTTSHPKDLDLDLMRCFAELPVLCPHVHLPVQSGSNAVLARMNRGYTAEAYLGKVLELRRLKPDITLATDFIVGFPGETEADFAATLRLLETVRFASSFSFKYSDRPQARASQFPDKIPEDAKAERLAQLQEKQNEITLEYNRALPGRTVEVLVESAGENGQGRTPGNRVVHFTAASGQALPAPGALVQVRIDRAGPHSLTGTWF